MNTTERGLRRQSPRGRPRTSKSGTLCRHAGRRADHHPPRPGHHAHPFRCRPSRAADRSCAVSCKQYNPRMIVHRSRSRVSRLSVMSSRLVGGVGGTTRRSPHYASYPIGPARGRVGGAIARQPQHASRGARHDARRHPQTEPYNAKCRACRKHSPHPDCSKNGPRCGLLHPRCSQIAITQQRRSRRHARYPDWRGGAFCSTLIWRAIRSSSTSGNSATTARPSPSSIQPLPLIVPCARSVGAV